MYAQFPDLQDPLGAHQRRQPVEARMLAQMERHFESKAARTCAFAGAAGTILYRECTTGMQPPPTHTHEHLFIKFKLESGEADPPKHQIKWAYFSVCSQGDGQVEGFVCVVGVLPQVHGSADGNEGKLSGQPSASACLQRGYGGLLPHRDRSRQKPTVHLWWWWSGWPPIALAFASSKSAALPSIAIAVK